MRRPALFSVCVVVIGSMMALASADDGIPVPPLTAASVRKPVPPARPPVKLDVRTVLAHAQARDGRWVATDARGRHIRFSIDPGLQVSIRKLFERYQVPYGALVAIEPSSGRVLAYVSHSSADPDAPDVASDPTPPSASVFKLVTASALLDAGVPPSRRVCYGGGASRLTAEDIRDDPRRDRNCATFAEAVGASINAVIAKLADRHLDAATLRRYAGRFGFGRALPCDLPAKPSPFEIPTQRLEFARTAAGFWHVHLSPLHAAMIAAAIANDGIMPSVSAIERIVGPDGRVVRPPPRAGARSVLSRATARTLGQMMQRTVREGTSRAAFHDSRGRPLLPGIAVAAKTGTLDAQHPYHAYSWWMGFAPADKPTIALAALVVNTPRWRIKSSFVAREALRQYLSR